MSGPFAWRAHRSADGAVQLARGLDLDAAIVGAGIAEAPARAARLHALCPMAHRIACAVALGLPLPHEPRAALDREAAAMAALRLGLSWALALGMKPDPAVGAARRAAACADDAAVAEALRALSDGPIAHAADAAGRAVLGDLPDPEHSGRVLAARFSAMAADARARAAALERGLRLAEIEGGAGVASLSTLRGALLVEADCRDETVRRYWSSAPTDRLMAPGGPVAVVLGQAANAAAARLALLALDPCGEIALTFLPERLDA